MVITMPKWKDPADIKRIKRVKEKLVAKRAAEREKPPPKLVLTKVPRPLQESEGFKRDAFDPIVYGGNEYKRDDKGGGVIKTEIKPKKKRKAKGTKNAKGKKDKKNR